MCFPHRPRSPGLLTARVLLAVALSACAATGTKHKSSFATAAHSNELTHATVYGTAPEPEPLRGDAADALLAETLSRSCEQSELIEDGRLAELALAIARASEGARRPPNYSLVSFHAHRAGLPEPTPQVWLASGPDTRALAPALEQAVRDAASSSHLTHCGAAAVAQGDRGVVVALALSTRVFSLREGVPRQVEPGASVRLEGELAARHEQPGLALTYPSGSVARRSLGSGSSFAYSVPTSERGEYTIELLATGPEGLTVVAMFPIAVGVELTQQAPELADDPVEADAEQVAARLSALIAEERRKRKLPPLRVEPRLTTIAQAHSEDMVRNRFIAHSSRRTGDATARVQSAGLDAMVVLENIGRGYSAAELHRGLMESPGHRGNILHPDAREIGIGVVAEREGERLAFIATELFTQLTRR
jgi:uncharacterized protein YkwD